MISGFSRPLVCHGRRRTRVSHLLWCKDNWVCPFCCCLFEDFIFEHPIDFRPRKLPCRWSISVQCIVNWVDVVASEFNMLFCGHNTSKVDVLHVREFCQEF